MKRISGVLAVMICLWLSSYTVLALPEGAVARLGKGSVEGGIAFSPDGRLLAVATSIGIYLYDPVSFKEMAFFETNECMISIAFSPDGKLLASGGGITRSGIVLLWDVLTQKEVSTLGTHAWPVTSIAFSPDGKLLASASRRDSTAILWDVSSQKEVANFWSSAYPVAFSPDGRLLASANWDDIVKLWDISSQKEVAVLKGHAWSVLSIAFSPDGRLLASASEDGTIKLWDISNQKEVATLSGHTGYVNSVAFSPDSRLLASGGGDKTVKLWDIVSQKEVATLRGHWGRVWSVAFSPDGRLLASGSLDKTVKLWDVSDKKEVATFSGHTYMVDSIAFSPEGRLLASGGKDGTIKLWDVSSYEEVGALLGHKGSVTSVAFSPDGKLLASGSEDKTAKLWDISSQKEVATLSGHTGSVNSVAFSPDGRLLASGSKDGTIKLWDVSSQKEVTTITGYEVVSSVAFSPDGRLLAGGGDVVVLWDVSGYKEVAMLGGIEGVDSIAFSPDGRLLASGGGEIVKLWDVSSQDVSSQKKLATLTTLGWGNVESVAFSPDGRLLASGNYETITVILWDVSSYKEVGTLYGHTGAVHSVAFSPDGRLLASGVGDGTILLWDLNPYTALLPPALPANQPPIASFTFTPKSPIVNEEVTFDASASQDPDGRIVSYRWDFGDLSTGKGETVKHSYSQKGQYTVTLKVFDNGGRTAIINSPITVEVALPSKITGKITDASTGKPVKGAKVSVNGNSYATEADGNYLLNVSAGSRSAAVSAAGYKLKASNVVVAAGQTVTINFALEPEVGCVIIVAGEGNWREALVHNMKADFAYSVFRKMGFKDEDIFYLNANKGVGGGVDGDCTLENLEKTVKQNALQRVGPSSPLILYMVGHGGEEAYFDLKGRDFIEGYKLEEWLGSFPRGIKMLIAIDSCYSGSFITAKEHSIYKKKNNISAENRVIITSCRADEQSYPFWSLFENFWKQMYKQRGKDIRSAFIRACKYNFEWGEPQFDDNGDSNQDGRSHSAKFLEDNPPMVERDEGYLAANMTIGGMGNQDILLDDLLWVTQSVFSPAEPRIYDSKGRVTGWVDNAIKEEIPGSLYIKESKTVIIWPATDTYKYEVVGTEKGTYGMRIISDSKETGVITATDIPMTSGTVHSYTVDWNALSKNEEGLTVQVDIQGDGNVEYTILADSTFTQDEYSANNVMPKGKYLTAWGEVKVTKLFQNYPNPFNPETWIPYQLAEESEVIIRISSTGGRLVRILELGAKSAGLHVSKDRAAHWDGCDDNGEPVASGVYFYTLFAGSFTKTKKMVISR